MESYPTDESIAIKAEISWTFCQLLQREKLNCGLWWTSLYIKKVC